jgi:hypothetical protein
VGLTCAVLVEHGFSPLGSMLRGDNKKGDRNAIYFKIRNSLVRAFLGAGLFVANVEQFVKQQFDHDSRDPDV